MSTPLSPTLLAHLAAARAAWPTLVWSDDAYVAWLRARGGDELEAKLAHQDPRDVVLCWAAGRGDPEAHRLFDAHFVVLVGPALRRFAQSAAFTDEVAQRVRVKLLVARPDHAEASIADMALGGSLVGLVRVAAVREAISLRRGDKPTVPVEDHEELAGETDPELHALKLKYAGEFERAFVAAVSELTPRDRQLLRLSMSARASIDDLARMFQTHRATAARWLNAARETLAEKTRAHLAARLGLGETELASLLRLVRTEATRMLDSIPPDDADDAS